MEEGWAPDPFARHEQRFFDGVRWTPYVKDGDTHGVDQPVDGASPPSQSPSASPPTGAGRHRAVAQARRSLFTQPVLVVHQRRKLVEVSNEYDVLDESGHAVGSVHEQAQGSARRALRALTDFDDALTHRLDVMDADGSLALSLTRRAPVGTRNGTVVVNSGSGLEIGRFEQEWRLGKTRFRILTDHGMALGQLNANNWRDWNHQVLDLTGREVASVSKSWRGLATELFTTADSYVVRVDPDLEGPLRTMAVAAALAIDLVRKQSDHSASMAYGGLGLAGELARSVLR